MAQGKIVRRPHLQKLESHLVKIEFNPVQKALLLKSKAAAAKNQQIRMRKLSQCRGLKNFNRSRIVPVTKQKKHPLLAQIPIKFVDLSTFDNKTMENYISELQQQYSQLGAVKLHLTGETAKNSVPFFQLLEGKILERGVFYRFKQIQPEVFTTEVISDSKKFQVKKKVFSQTTFWKNVKRLRANQYGDISIAPPFQFSKSFPAINQSFSSRFPQKAQQFTYKTIYGGEGSISGWQLNPYSLAGVNLNVAGGSKLWYFVPKKYSQAFGQFLRGLPIKEGQSSCARFHSSTISSPSRLPYLNSTIQNQKQIVIIFPGVYHSGINLGSNICCSSVLTTPNWFQQTPTANCQCAFQLNNQMFGRMGLKSSKMSSSQGIVLQYQSMSSEPSTTPRIPTTTFPVLYPIKKQDYFFSLRPKRGKCFFKQSIQLSLMPKNLAVQGSNLIVYTPKFNLDKSFKTRAFYNWATSKQNYSSWSDQSESEQQSVQNIYVAKPRGKNCKVCNCKFQDYLVHIKSQRHLAGLQQQRGKYEQNWMLQLPNYGRVNSNSNNFVNFRWVAAPKLSKNQEMLALLIVKADTQNCRKYSKVMEEIRKLTSQIKFSPQVTQAIKKCAICKSNTTLLDKLDRQWLVCCDCNEKVHQNCLKFDKCEFCLYRPKPYIEKWSQDFNQLVKGIESLSYVDHNLSIPEVTNFRDNELKIKRHLQNKRIQYRRTTTFYDNHIIDPLKVFYEPHLGRVSFQVEKIYKRYCSGDYFPPIELLEISEKVGFGVFATLDILPNTFICEYGGDVIPAAFANLNDKYNMELLQGPCTFSSLIITVFKTSSVGPLLNHSDNPNCRTLRCIIGHCPRVIFYTIRSIQKGEQLFYCKNSSQKI